MVPEVIIFVKNISRTLTNRYASAKKKIITLISFASLYGFIHFKAH